MLIIEVNNVTKEYRLGQVSNLKQSMQGIFARLRGQNSPERPQLYSHLGGHPWNE